MGQWDTALQASQAALDAVPVGSRVAKTAKEVWKGIRLAYASRLIYSQPEQARALVQEVLSRDPSDAEARRFLEEMERGKIYPLPGEVF
jgi:hypothetical protein